MCPSVLLSHFILLNCLSFSGTSIHTNFEEIKGEDLISTTCNHTLYYDICVSSLRSDPNSKTADLLGLAKIALNISKVYGEQTVSHISELKSKATGNDTVSSCFSVCIEEYEDANENLEQAVEALREMSSDDLKTYVSSAMTDSDTCEQCFEEMEESDPVSDRNLYFSKLCSNFLAIASVLSP